jgi:hypothetical protein
MLGMITQEGTASCPLSDAARDSARDLTFDGRAQDAGAVVVGRDHVRQAGLPVFTGRVEPVDVLAARTVALTTFGSGDFAIDIATEEFCAGKRVQDDVLLDVRQIQDLTANLVLLLGTARSEGQGDDREQQRPFCIAFDEFHVAS